MAEATVDMLNALWTTKRALIDQYVARSKVRAARGDEELAERFSDFAFGQMRVVSGLLDRIVALDGIPQLRPVQPVPVGAAIPDQLHHSRQAEMAIIPQLEDARRLCGETGDAETLALIEAALEQAHERLEWLASAALDEPQPLQR